MTNDIEKKPYEDVVHDGKPARLYPNGVIRSPKGYIVHMPPEVASATRTQTAIKGEERAQEAIKLATQSESPDEAVMKIIRARTHVAMNDMGRAGNDAAKFVLERAGYVQNERKVEVVGRINHVPMPPPEKLKHYKDIIEAEVNDDEG